MPGESAVNPPPIAISAIPSPPPAAAPPAAPVPPRPAGGRIATSYTDQLRAATATKTGSPLAVPPPKAAPVAAAPPVPPAATPPAAPEVVPPAANPVPTQPEPKVTARGGVLSEESLNERLQRDRNKLLREHYGTSDPAEIARIKTLTAAQLEEYKTLKAQQEETDRAAMTEQQRLAADRDAIAAERDELRTRLEDLETGQVVSQQTQELQGIAGKFIKPKLIAYALIDFQKHVRELATDEIKRITPGSIQRWFRKFSEDNEEFKLVELPPEDPTAVVVPAAPPAVVATAKPPVRRIGITTSTAPKGGTPKAPPAKDEPGTYKGKTVRPGLSNSMNTQELKEYMAMTGRKTW